MTYLFFAVLVSTALSAGLVFGTRWHIRHTADCSASAAHKTHVGVVPRVGGVPIFLAAVLGMALMTPDLYPAVTLTFWVLMASVSLIFATGLLEDLTNAVMPWLRYGACVLGALLFSLAHDQFGISSVSLPGVDLLLGFGPLSIAFFVFAVAGVTHAFNLIDGQNGLCSGYALLAFLVLGFVAGQAGQAHIAIACELMMAANLGFLVFNYPAGRLFLGDGGAYLNGAALGMLIVLLVEQSPGVAPWFAITVLAYPVTEAVFTIFRRSAARRAFYHADTDHLHHRIERALSTTGRAAGRTLAAPVLLAIAAPALATAALLPGETGFLIAACLAYLVAYVSVYRSLGAYAVKPVATGTD